MSDSRIFSRHGAAAGRLPVALITLLLGGVISATLAGCAGPSAQADACASPLSTSITNSCVVRPGVLWRGAKPDAPGAAALVDLGVHSVVNLELLHDDLAAFTDARPDSASAARITYFRIRDWEPNVLIAPDRLDAHIAEFLAIVRSQPKPVYVHCRSGQNRTGVMVAAYRIFEEGLEVEAAIGEMRKYQGIWFAQDAAYLRELAGARRARIEAQVAQWLPKLRQTAQLQCSAAGCRSSQAQ